MLMHIDRCKFTDVPAPGTGAVALGGLTPPTGFRTLATVPTGGVDVEYLIVDAAGNFETGIGALNATTGALTRTLALSSHSAIQGESPATVNFTAAVTVLICPLATNAVVYHPAQAEAPTAEVGAVAIGSAYALGANSVAINGVTHDPRTVALDADADEMGGGLVLSATGPNVTNDVRGKLWLGKASTLTGSTVSLAGKGYQNIARQIVGAVSGTLTATLVGSDYSASHWKGELSGIFINGAIVAQTWTLIHQVGSHTPPAPQLVNYTYPEIELQPYAGATWDVAGWVEVLAL
jgi:hypothetical protein